MVAQRQITSVDDIWTPDVAVLSHYVDVDPGDPSATRTSLQQLIDRIKPSGSQKTGTLFVPPFYADAPITLDYSGVDNCCIDVPSNVTIDGAGAGSVFKLAADTISSVRMFRVQGKENVAIRNLRIDGNADNNDETFEQNHNIFVYDSTNTTIENVESVDATGDDLFIGGTGTGPGSVHTYVDRVRATGAKRNPVTVQHASETYITRSYLLCAADSGGQAIDSEPDAGSTGPYDGLYVWQNEIGHANPAAFAISLGGLSQAYPRGKVRMLGNTFLGGGISMPRVKDVVIAYNQGTLRTVDANAYSEDVQFLNNVWDIDQAAGSYAFELYFSLSEYPRKWTIRDNHLRLLNGAHGYRIRGADDIAIEGGIIEGDGTTATAVGINAIPTRTMANLRATGVRFRDIGKAFISSGSSTNRIDGLTVGDFQADNLLATSGAAIELIPATASVLTGVVVLPSVLRNLASGLSELSLHNSTFYAMAGIVGSGAVYNCAGTPEGQIAARIGAMALRRDGGASTTLYVKESGTGSTGWRAV